MKIAAIGLDLAKRVSQVHAVNGAGEAAVRKRNGFQIAARDDGALHGAGCIHGL